MDREADEVAERLNAILESAVDGFITIDEAGIVESVNAACVEIFGYERSELIGSSVNLLMPEPDSQAHDGHLVNYLRSGQSKIIGTGREVSGRRNDGSEFPLYLAVSEGMHDGRKLFTAIVRDLTELRRAEERAKSAEEIASLSVIAAGIAHDISTPMNVILGYSEMLQDSLPNAKDRRRAAVISEQIRRVTALLQTLLNLARPRKPVKMPVQMDEILDHALDFCRERLRAGKIEVDRDVRPAPHVLGDRDRLEQMLLNLIVNAADAMPEGGRLMVSLKSVDAGWIEIVLADTGLGIAADVLAQVFEPFYTTKERGKGTGLGLVVANSIVSDHAGTIECESELGKGTRFVIRLPVVETAQQRASRKGDAVSRDVTPGHAAHSRTAACGSADWHSDCFVT